MSRSRLLSVVDAADGDRARRRRQGLKEKDDDPDIRAVLGKPVTFKYFLKFLTYYLGPTFATYRFKGNETRTRLEALEQEFAALKAEITAIKAQPHGLSYAGTWQRERPYGKDTGVTHHGSLWSPRGRRRWSRAALTVAGSWR